MSPCKTFSFFMTVDDTFFKFSLGLNIHYKIKEETIRRSGLVTVKVKLVDELNSLCEKRYES
jgi:hypothetical protein